MIDLQDYAEIVAKRPELAVPGLAWFPGDLCLDVDGGPCPPMWTIHENGPFMHAEALIGWHWTRMLPTTCCLRHNLDDPPRWTCGNVCNEHGQASGPDPLSALTAFWRQYT